MSDVNKGAGSFTPAFKLNGRRLITLFKDTTIMA